MTLREARKAAGLTQKGLAEASGVAHRTIQKIESGESELRNVTIATMQALTGALGVDIGEITEQEAEPENGARPLRVNSLLTHGSCEGLTPEDRRALLKGELAREYSGLRPYPGICSAVFARIPESWWAQYSARHLGEVARLLKAAYDDGKNGT